MKITIMPIVVLASMLHTANATYVLSNEVQMIQIEYSRDRGLAGDYSDDTFWYTLDFETSLHVTSIRMQTPGGVDVSSSNATVNGSSLKWRIYEADTVPWDSRLDGLLTMTFEFDDATTQSTIYPYTHNDGSSPIPPFPEEPQLGWPDPIHGSFNLQRIAPLRWPPPPAAANFHTFKNKIYNEDDTNLVIYSSGAIINVGGAPPIDGPMSTLQTPPFLLRQGLHAFSQYYGFIRAVYNADGIPCVATKQAEIMHNFYVFSPRARYDDFNDNTLRAGHWDDVSPLPGAELTNVNERLEYRSTGMVGTIGKSWSGHQLSATQNWSVAVNATILNQLPDVALVLSVESDQTAVHMKFGYRSEWGISVLSEAIDISAGTNLHSQLDYAIVESNETLWIEYDVDAQRFYTKVFQRGRPATLGVIDASEMGFTSETVFEAMLNVENTNTVVAASEVFFDDFMIWWGDESGHPGDSDDDGLPDDWEMQYFGSIDHPNAHADADGDADTVINWKELLMGSNPTNSASFLQLSNPWKTTEGWGLNRDAETGRVYSIEWTDHLTNAFQSLEDEIVHPQASFTDAVHTADSAGFYMLNVELDN
ncbi:hypothetical protein P4C99_01880 [Pontiellaceae bacterium B1224]|nr:hypothetical protein [Pontiellaceae bacterium B1224]